MAGNVPAATRTLAVLRALASAAAPLTAASLARDLYLPRSTVYHLLSAMEDAGFVAHYPEEGRWGLGVAAFEVGAAYLRHDPLERLARAPIQRLAAEVAHITPAVALLGVLHGRETLYLLKDAPSTPEAVIDLENARHDRGGGRCSTPRFAYGIGPHAPSRPPRGAGAGTLPECRILRRPHGGRAHDPSLAEPAARRGTIAWVGGGGRVHQRGRGLGSRRVP